ncbi:MAG: hypothetical protein ACOX8I_09305 [Bacillota bacterium]
MEKEYEGELTQESFAKATESMLQQVGEVLRGKEFKEFDEFDACGYHGRWRFCDVPSPKYADGHYYKTEKLALMPVYALIESSCDQQITMKLNAGRVCAWLNGDMVFDNNDFYYRERERIYVFEHAEKPNHESVRMQLKAGMNSLLILTGHVGRGTGISISMELLSCDEPIVMHVPIRLDTGIRETIALSKRMTHMVDDCYKVGETPVLHVGDFPKDGCKVSVELSSANGECMRLENICENEIAFPGILVEGNYSVHVEWRLSNGVLVDDLSTGFFIVDVLQPDPGFERFGARRQTALELLAEQGDPLALYRLKRFNEINEEKITEMCERIEQRADCADFDLLPLLWMVWEDRDIKKLGDNFHAKIKKAALGFRYWVDEPGTSSMFYCSENHRIAFHVCEYLAGLLYPTDLFTNSGQNGMYHSLKGRMHLIEWLDQRCRMGFDEPHSDTYLPITLSAILVLREVLPREEYPLRNMVNVLLDFMSFLFAVSSFDGIMATPRGRSYNVPLRTKLLSNIGGVFWMMFGNSSTNRNRLPSELAFSYYVPPKGICELAYNQTPATFTYKQGLMHFDKHNADFVIRRTPDYMIGGVRDHNVGMCDMHFVPAMIALKNDITIFFSAPNNVAEGSGLRPDYWAGQAFLPRVLMAKRTLAVIWHNVNDPDIWMTHCHFNVRKFDEVVSRDGWTFGRSGDGYVAIYSSSPHSFRLEGPYAGRELISDGNETVWIAECGSSTEDGSFEAFIQKILSSQCWQDDAGFHFNSPGSGLMEFGLCEGFSVDRKDVPISEYMVDSPWLRSLYGSGKFEYTCPDYSVTQWTYPASK